MARKSRKNLDNTVTQEIQKPVYKAGAYIRLSVIDVKQKSDSIETQQSLISSFIAEHPDLELCETYIDNGLSGQSFERPAFQRMIADMESGRINCCICKDLSRLGRNAIDTGFYIEKFFPTHNIRFIAVTDNYDSADGRSGGIMISLKNMVNETYALEVGRKIRATHKMNIDNGRFVGNMPPYGYLKSRDDCYVLAPDEYAASIVRQIFEMAAEEQSIKSIMEWLTENEILTPSRYLHSIGLLVEAKISPHIHWSYQAVSTILRNRIYCGDMVQGKTKITGQTSKKIPKSDWVIVENTHTHIVSRELFDEVQTIRDKTGGVKESVWETPAKANIFAQKLFCAHCGFAMTRRRYNENTYGYVCGTFRLYAKGACDGAKISEKAALKMLFNILSKQESALSDILSSISQENHISSDTVNDELISVQSELAKNKHFLKGLYESLINDDITNVEYKDLKSAYESKIAVLTEQEKRLRESKQKSIRKENALSSAHTSVKSLGQISDLTAEVIGRLVEKINVRADKSITVKFTFSEEIFECNGGADNE